MHTMPARLRFSIALLLISRHAAVVGAKTPAKEELTPGELERKRFTEAALVEAEEQQRLATPQPARRHAPNGDTLDAQDFLESLGEPTLRCSACELVAVKFEQAFKDEELVTGWAANTSAERATALRATLPKRACAKIKRMKIAIDGEEVSLKYVDVTNGTPADVVAADLGAMGLEHRETVRTLCTVLAKMDPEPMVSQIEQLMQQKPGIRLDQINLRDAICVELLGECSSAATATQKLEFLHSDKMEL